MRKSICTACLALLVLASANLASAQSADDKAIAQQIGRNLKDSGQLRDYKIGVKYQQGVAWLSGSVANEQQLGAAMRLTQGMPGVKRVVNNLSIAGAPGATNNLKTMELGQPLKQASAQTIGSPNARPRVNQAYMPPQGRPQQRAAQLPPRQYRTAMAARPMPQRPMPQHPMSQQMAGRPMGPMGPGPAGPMGPGPGGPMGPGGPGGPMQAGCNCDGGPAYGGGGGGMMMGGGPGPSAMGYVPGAYGGAASYDNASMPGYAWPSYASYPNYAALTYPRQYSPTAWPYIGPFYPYPQVPLGWRKVSLEWDDGWWFLDFSDCGSNH